MEAINRQTWKQRMASYKRNSIILLPLVLVTASAPLRYVSWHFADLYPGKGYSISDPKLICLGIQYSENVSPDAGADQYDPDDGLSLVIAVPLGIFACDLSGGICQEEAIRSLRSSGSRQKP